MRIILSQPVKIEGEPDIHRFSKEYESDIMPVVGAEVEDPLWKDPYEYKITGFTINYYDNSCYVGLKTYNGEIPKERKEFWADVAKSHGWKASWDFR